MNDAKKTILIVEDDESLLKILSHTLESEGFTVIKAENGEIGIAKALEHQPDLMLLDIVLPKVDGLSVLKRLHDNERGKNIPVIALTNLGDIKTVSEMLTHGVSDYLIKSEWKLDDLVRKVKSKLKN